MRTSPVRWSCTTTGTRPVLRVELERERPRGASARTLPRRQRRRPARAARVLCLSVPRPELAFASPRKLPRARDLKGRVVVLDVAFASEAASGGFEKITLPFIQQLGPRLAGWVDHHDHVMHERYRERPALRPRDEGRARRLPRDGDARGRRAHRRRSTPSCATPTSTGCAAPPSGCAAAPSRTPAPTTTRAPSTRAPAQPGPIGQRFDRALRARPRDTALFGLVVRHLAGGLGDASLWGAIDRAAAELAAIEERHARDRRRLRRGRPAARAGAACPRRPLARLRRRDRAPRQVRQDAAPARRAGAREPRDGGRHGHRRRSPPATAAA